MSSGWNRSLTNSTAALFGEKTHGCPRPRNNYSGGFLDESVRQENRLSPFCLHASTSFRGSRRSHWAVSTLLQTCCELHAQRAPAQVMGATTGNATRQSATLVPQIAAMLFTLAHHPALERLERRFGTLQDMRCVLGREI
jgi:hypothetical protein